MVKKNPPDSAGETCDVGSIPRSGRSPGGGHANPLQYSCPENPMDRKAWHCSLENTMDIGAWQATVHRVTKSLNDWIYLAHTYKLNDCPNLLSQQMAESGRICIQIHPKPAFLPSTLVLKRSFPIGFLVSIMYLELSVSHTVHYFPALKSEHIWNKLPLASHVHSSVLHDHELVKAGLSTVISLSAWFSLF